MKYRIKKAGHYAWPLLLRLHTGKVEQAFTVKFSPGCTLHPNTEDDWCKLFGWSYGYHMNNSIRVGWRPTPGPAETVDLALFKHEAGEFSSGLTWLTVPAGTEVRGKMWLDGRGDFCLELSCGEQYLLTHIHGFEDARTYGRWGYFLKPYYGGDAPAPAECIIELILS